MLRSHTRLQPPYDPDEVIVARVHVIAGCEGQRSPNHDWPLEEAKIFGHDTRDRVEFAAQVYLPSDDIGVAAEAAFPQTVAENGDPMLAPLFVAPAEAVAEKRLHAHRREQAGGNRCRYQHLGSVPFQRHTYAAIGEGAHVLEGMIIAAPHAVVGR